MAEEKNNGIFQFFRKSIDRKMLLGFGTLILLIVLLGALSFFQFSRITEPIYNELPKDINLVARNARLDSVAQQVRYYDELLTMSARNYAFTGDKRWKDRYNAAVPELDSLITEAIDNGDDTDRGYFSKIDAANIALINMETQAIILADEGRKEEAIAILDSNEYSQQKDVYALGLKKYAERREQQINYAISGSANTTEKTLEKTRKLINESLFSIIAIIVVAILISIIITWLVSKFVSKPIMQLKDVTEELEKGNFAARAEIHTGDELEKLGTALNSAIEQLGRSDEEKKQLDKAKTEFISITSHELRSPMTPMKAQLQMLTEGYFGKLNKKQSDAVDIVMRNTDRLDHIILDFLEISRIEAARLKFNFAKTSLEPHINRLIEEMNSYLPEKKIVIEKNIEKLPEFEVDPDRVMQVLRNLINNAKKFTPENGKIILAVKVEATGLLFSVKDSGIGIAKENQARIFEPFFQEEQTMYRQYGGTGLGLAICKGIIESQNGKIWFESDRGKGTNFFFTVPFEPVREIKPIKVLFSSQSQMEKEFRKIFKEMLGPLGEKEFEQLQKKGTVSQETIIKYFGEMEQKGIITKENLERIKNNKNLSFNSAETKQEIINTASEKKFASAFEK